MQLNITARHTNLTPALTDYVQRKVEKAQKYFDDIIWAQAILVVEKHRHIAELVVHTPGSTFRVKGEAGDLYSAIDLATHKLDVHLSRVKDRQRNRKHPEGVRMKSRPVIEETVFSAAGENGNDEKSPVFKTESVLLRTLPVSQAIREFNSGNKPAFLFINSKTDRISVLYRKGRQGYGILQAEEA
jgi:putative sigma-54 modulation protein